MATSFNVFRHVDQDFNVEGAYSVGTAQDLIVTIVEDSDMSSSQSSKESFSTNKSVYILFIHNLILQIALQNFEGYLEAEKDEFFSDVGSILLLAKDLK